MVSDHKTADQPLDMWLQRTQWLVRFVKVNVALEAEKTTMQKSDPIITLLTSYTLHYWHLCYLATTSAFPNIRRAIRSIDGNESSKPLKSLDKQTQTTYAQLWSKFIAYIYHREGASNRDTNNNPAYCLPMNEKISNTWKMLHEHACQMTLPTRGKNRTPASDGHHIAVLGPPTPDYDNSTMIELVGDFLFAVITQDVSVGPWQSCLVHFSGILGWRSKSQAWQDAVFYRPNLSAIIVGMRLIVCNRAMAESKSDQILESVKASTRVYLWTSSPTPFDWIFSLSMAAKTQFADYNRAPTYSWANDRRTLYYQKHELDVHRLLEYPRQEINDLEARAVRLIFRNKGFLAERNPVDMHDHPYHTGQGWSFADLQTSSIKQSTDLRSGAERVLQWCQAASAEDALWTFDNWKKIVLNAARKFALDSIISYIIVGVYGGALHVVHLFCSMHVPDYLIILTTCILTNVDD